METNSKHILNWYTKFRGVSKVFGFCELLPKRFWQKPQQGHGSMLTFELWPATS